MALCEPLDCHCLDCNSILKSSHGLCCDKHINAEEKGSICLQKLTTVTVRRLREGERKKGQPQKCLCLMVNIHPPPFRIAWDSLCSRDLLCPKIRSASSQTPGSQSSTRTPTGQELRCLLWTHAHPLGHMDEVWPNL